MADLSYQRTIIAYHGCDASVVSAVLNDGHQLKPSENDYDWLGRGIYFWEHGPRRALEWAKQRVASGSKNIRHPAVLGAYIHLGNCFDLLNTANTEFLGRLFPLYQETVIAKGLPLPQNLPGHARDSGDLVKRYLDCAVVNWSLDFLEQEENQTFHSVRCVFSEGDAAFPGSRIQAKSHIQIAVRDPKAIIGFFKPNIDTLAE